MRAGSPHSLILKVGPAGFAPASSGYEIDALLLSYGLEKYGDPHFPGEGLKWHVPVSTRSWTDLPERDDCFK